MRTCVFLVLACLAGGAHAQAPSDAERAAALEIYRKIVSLDTSVDGGETPAMASYLADRFRAAGFAEEDVHVLPLPSTAALAVRYRGDGTQRGALLLLAHMDVVPARRSEWERDPFTLIEEDGFFFGRGSADNKSGVALITATFLRLRAAGFKPTRDVVLWFSGDEETTGATTMEMLAKHRDWLGDVELALNSDAGGGTLAHDGRATAYMLQTAEKTYADFKLTARNPGGHSSMPRADNAIFDLMDALGRIRGFEFPVMWNDTTIASFRSTGKEVGGDDGAAMLRFAQRPGDAEAAATLSRNPVYVGQVRTTCVPTMLAAGHATNALPQTATANVNCRIFPGVAPAAVQAELQRLAGEAVEVEQDGDVHFSDASPLRADVVAAVTAAVHARYPGIPITPAMEVGATDGLFFRAAGIPTYGVSELFIRDEDLFMHGLNERNPVASFYDGLRHWRVLIEALAGPNAGSR
ncbi:MAG TPA: M20/M25/M40 family metallo-hydrolase [Gammaproteobacteria bacterium]|nr:M20/M25/M40 family metallo-hydrolase [Gammaproteobacteria bacterium]